MGAGAPRGAPPVSDRGKHDPMKSRALLRVVPLLLGAVAAAGCQSPLRDPGTEEFRLAPGFESRRPSDVAVLPVAGTLPEGRADALREALRDRLRDLRYAPVRSRTVDQTPKEFRPGGPNAVLEVVVTRWDEAGMWGNGSLHASAEVRLYGAGSAEPLYRAVLASVTVRASFVARTMDDRPRTYGQAAEELAEALLKGLPTKGDG